MNFELAYSVSQGDPTVMDAFGSALDSTEKWASYLTRWYGRDPGNSTLEHAFQIIGNPNSQDIAVHEAFVALFVAAWISRPLCKAAYTLELSGMQPHQCHIGFQKLFNRKSSHITSSTGSGMSAYKAMEQTVFKGARELLVQGIRYRSFETTTNFFGITSQKSDKMKSSRTAIPDRLFLKAEGWNCTWGQIIEHGQQWWKSVGGGHDAYYSEEFGAMYESENNLRDGVLKPNGWGIEQRETEKKKELEGVKKLSKSVKANLKTLKIKGANFKLNKDDSTMTMRELIAMELFIVWGNDPDLKGRILQHAGRLGVTRLFSESNIALYNDVLDSDNRSFSDYLSVLIAIGTTPTLQPTKCEKQIMAARQGLERVKKQVLLDDTSLDKITRRTGLEVAISAEYITRSLNRFRSTFNQRALIRPLGNRRRSQTMLNTFTAQR